MLTTLILTSRPSPKYKPRGYYRNYNSCLGPAMKINMPTDKLAD